MPVFSLSAVPMPGVSSLPILAAALFVLVLTAISFGFTAFMASPAGVRMVKRHLGWHLDGTRMVLMLGRHHVTPEKYLAQTPIADIRNQLRTCRNCSRQSQCDQVLSYDGLKHRSLAFCPNHRAIERVAAS